MDLRELTLLGESNEAILSDHGLRFDQDLISKDWGWYQFRDLGKKNLCAEIPMPKWNSSGNVSMAHHHTTSATIGCYITHADLEQLPDYSVCTSLWERVQHHFDRSIKDSLDGEGVEISTHTHTTSVENLRTELTELTDGVPISELSPGDNFQFLKHDLHCEVDARDGDRLRFYVNNGGWYGTVNVHTGQGICEVPGMLYASAARNNPGLTYEEYARRQYPTTAFIGES